MRVTVKLFASLKGEHPEEQVVEVVPGTTVEEIVRHLALPEGQVTLIFVNGRHSEPGRQLTEGDVIALFPPIGGG